VTVRRVGRSRAALVAAAALAVGAAAPAAASACLEVGVYRDAPAQTIDALTRKVGPGVSVLSTYVTVGRPIDPALLKLARGRRLRVLVSWMPDAGRDNPNQPGYSLAAVASGRFDRQLRTLARQIKRSGVSVVFRPMPEPNTPWYAWSGTVNGNAPERYVAAWRHVHAVVKPAAGRRIRFLWSPYARSVPETEANAISRYWPGPDVVDLEGVSGYNFGAQGGLSWVEPKLLFQDAYAEIQALAPKPFWIAETGSTALGGSRAAWLRSLATLGATMPKLRGVVLYDVKERTGDFRVSTSRASAGAVRAVLARRCTTGAPARGRPRR